MASDSSKLITRKQTSANGNIVGNGEVAKLIRNFSWSRTALGPIEQWPQSLITAVNMILQSPVPLVILWGHDGYMIYNEAYSVLASKRHPEILGNKVVKGWPEIADFNRNVMHECLAGKTLSYVDQKLTLNRNRLHEEVWFDLNYSPIIDESGKPNGVLAIVVETTERVLAEKRQHRAEEALLAEREHLQSLLQRAPAMIAVLQGKDLMFEMANKRLVDTFLRGKDVTGKPLLEVMPELKGQDAIKRLGRVLKTGQPYVGELQVKLDRHADGKPEKAYFSVSFLPNGIRTDGKPDGVFIHAVEITDQVVSLREAERLSAQLQAVIDSLPDGVYLAMRNAPDKIAHINQRGAEVLGYDSPDQVPREISELHAQVAMQYSRGKGKKVTVNDSALLNGMSGKSVQRIGVEVYNHITGRRLIIRTAGSPIRDKKGNIIGSVAVNTDLTKVYNLQEKIQKAVIQRRLLTATTRLLVEQNEQLTQLNATKDEFIALTSHQLRTPATGVKQYVGMLLQGFAGSLTPVQEEYLEKAFESNERQLLIIDEILRVARLDMGRTKVRKEACDIAKLTRSVLEEQADKFNERGLQLLLDFPVKPIVAQVDPIQLHMAIGNLVDNAIKYTPDQRKIWVRLRQVDNSAVTIDVRDQGVGIAEKDYDKLFLKFSRIHNPQSVAVGGSGLGLYWTKRIIELHGGEITVRSKSGRGSTFSVRLPLE